MELTLTSPSTALPVTMEEAKDHLYVTDDRYRGAIRGKLRGAVDYCQRQVLGHRQFMSATYQGTMRAFPLNDGPVPFPVPPLQSVTTVAYVNSTGGSTTLSSTAYDTVTPSESPGRIEPAYGKTWPSTRDQASAVTITFVAGWANTKDVPDSIKQAILMKLEHLWDPGCVKEVDLNRAIGDLLAGHDYGNYS